jgi:hypothetical protein
VKILSTVHSLDPKVAPGDIVDMEDEMARRWIADGLALRVEDDPPPVVETEAFAGAPETAVGRRQRRTPT